MIVSHRSEESIAAAFQGFAAWTARSKYSYNERVNSSISTRGHSWKEPKTQRTRLAASIRLQCFAVIFCLLTAGACSSSDQGTTTPGVLGSIAGLLHSSAGNGGIAGAAVVLRRSTGDSVSSVATDSSGRFRFSELIAGTYHVSVRIPPGHTASAVDTARAVSIGAGEAATVDFIATPITEVVDTVRTKNDTIVLANGARVILALASGASPVVAIVRVTAADKATWGRVVIGSTVEVIFPQLRAAANRLSIRSSQSLTDESPLTVFFSLPVTGVAAPPADPAVRGLFVASGSDSPASGTVKSAKNSIINPLTGTSQAVLSGQFELTPGDLKSLRLSIVAARLVCPDQFDLTKDEAFTGIQPLVLIHGLNPQVDDCDDDKDWNPATDTFKDLIEALKANPTIRSTYSVYVYKYPTYAGVVNAANGLATKYFAGLTKNGAKVTFIAHSMGGLVARQLLKTTGLASVAQIITLATPHFGTPLADATDQQLAADEVRTCYRKAELAPLPA
ncbi:MAG: hypothetical protein JWP08_482, partial [Bryobacterales bacterium]|nr:hypothetical protein [Bryobacterales bacterium]